MDSGVIGSDQAKNLPMRLSRGILLSRERSHRTRLMDYDSLLGKTNGQIIAELTGGANLVNGKQTFDCIKEGKNDINVMMDCCRAELRQHEAVGAAPYYFDRAAMLFNKAKQYELTVKICEVYLSLDHEAYFFANSPRVNSIRKRLEKAQKNLVKQIAQAV